MATDFEAEGLLDGADGASREARLSLLRRLEDDGVPLEELRAAVKEGRLALVPVERVLVESTERLSLDEIASRTEVEPEFLERYWRASGLVVPDRGETVWTDSDLEAAERLAELRDAGLTDDSILEFARVASRGLNPLAITMARGFTDSYLGEGDNEASVGERMADASRQLIPLLGPALEYGLQVQLRALLRQTSMLGDSIPEGRLPEGSEVAVAFADLVDFTKLGEGVDAGALGAVAARLEDLAVDVAVAPVRLVKTIGDAVMLESPETEALVDAALALLEAGEAEDDGFPQLSIGIAYGEAILRGGDWFGQPVNLASRVTSVARPGSVLITEPVKDALGEGYATSFAGERRLKGVTGAQKLFRVRRASAD